MNNNKKKKKKKQTLVCSLASKKSNQPERIPTFLCHRNVCDRVTKIGKYKINLFYFPFQREMENRGRQTEMCASERQRARKRERSKGRKKERNGSAGPTAPPGTSSPARGSH